MNEIHRKILSILDRDVICELKNAENHIPESLLFHNHDGCEIYLFLNGDVNYYTESSGKKLERGDLILTRAYAFHGSVLVSPALHDRIVINIRESVLSGLGSPETDLSECFLRTPSSELNLLHLEEDDIRRFPHSVYPCQKNSPRTEASARGPFSIRCLRTVRLQQLFQFFPYLFQTGGVFAEGVSKGCERSAEVMTGFTLYSNRLRFRYSFIMLSSDSKIFNISAIASGSGSNSFISPGKELHI